MTDLTKIKIAKLLMSARFWVATFVFYLTTQGIPTGEVFYLMGIYYVASFLFEYPTGVIGDYYSHKISVFLGLITIAISYVIISFSGSFWFYIFPLLLLALGQALVSGSDNAILYGLSKDFKKDLSQIRAYGWLVSFAAISIGGFVSVYDLRYPLYLTSIFWVAASIFVFSIKRYDQSKLSGNIFAAGKVGIQYALSNKILMHLIILSGLIGGLFYSFKWLYNPLFLELKLDVSVWGVLAGVGMLMVVAGIKIYQKFSFDNNFVLLILLIISMFLFGFTSLPAVALLGLFLSHLVRGYFETSLTVEIMGSVGESMRSSILSLKALLTKVGATIIMGAGGFLLDRISFFQVTIYISACLIVFGTFSAIITTKTKRLIRN